MMKYNEFIWLFDEGALEDLFDELNDPILREEVAKSVKMLKRGKTAASDLLVSGFF